MFYDCIDSPVGSIYVIANDTSLVKVDFDKQSPPPKFRKKTNSVTDKVKQQLYGYFSKQLKYFELDIENNCPPFQQQILKLVKQIPYGTTKSYLEIAKLYRGPNYSRAVGIANAKNPLPIIIPCHRVISSNGKLNGYTGGKHIKKFLINFEREC